MSDELQPNPSQAAIAVPPATAPQRPPAVARHPFVALATAVAIIIASIAALDPGSDAAAVKANALKLDAVQLDSTKIKDDQADIKRNLDRFTDRFGDRVEAVEKRLDKLDRYHESVDRHWTDLVLWQSGVLRRVDKLEEKR